MKKLPGILALMILPISLTVASAISAEAATTKSYVATDDDNPNGNTTTVYVWNGKKLTQIVGSPFSTGGLGLGGAYFGIPEDAISVNANGKCLFVADSGGSSGNAAADIAAFSLVSTGLTLVGNYVSGAGYLGNEYGLGLVVSGNTLYANYTGSMVVEQWTIGKGCTLTDTGNSASDVGGNGGVADGMVVSSKGRCLFAANDDGTVTANTTSPFAVVGIYTAGGYTADGGLPVTIHVVGNHLIADDLVGDSALYDTWTIGSNCTLSDDLTSGPLGGSIYGSNTFNTSPDGTCSFDIGTFSGTMQTDVIGADGSLIASSVCEDVSMPSYGSTWIYPGQGGLALNSGGTAEIFVAEGSFGYSANSFVGEFSISKSGCMKAGAEVDDASMYLLSLATYPTNPTQDADANPPTVGPHCTH
jgi:hypothetical protein